MGAQQDPDELRARISELEAENRQLQDVAADTPGDPAAQGARWRSILAAVLITVSIIVAPIAVLGTWARIQLVDTDRFVQTFSPLVNEPAMQELVTDEVATAIEESLHLDQLVGDVFAGLDELPLPPRAAESLALLEAPAAEGLRSMLHSGVEDVVESPRFANLWETALRESHDRGIAVIEGDPNTALELTDDATLSIRLDVVIREVKETLIAQGYGLASAIPEIDRSIPLASADAFVLVRTVYLIAVHGGFWLPWVLLGMLVGGIALSRNRTRALAWTGVGLALSLAALAGGLGIGRLFFIRTVSPTVMSAETATLLFDHLTALISSTILALVVLNLLIALGAWLAGGSTHARAIREATDSGFDAVRSAADRRGLSTGETGRHVERWHSAIIVATVGIGVLVLFLNRPPSLSGVVTTLIVVLLVLTAVELVRRPAPRT